MHQVFYVIAAEVWPKRNTSWRMRRGEKKTQNKSRQRGGKIRKGSAEGKTKGRGRNADFYCGFLFLPLPLVSPFA